MVKRNEWKIKSEKKSATTKSVNEKRHNSDASDGRLTRLRACWIQWNWNKQVVEMIQFSQQKEFGAHSAWVTQAIWNAQVFHNSSRNVRDL